MASVSKRGNLWCVRYRYTDELGAVKMKRVSGFKTKEDAMAAAKSLEAKSNAGFDVNGDRATCGQIMERWFSEHCAYLSPTTRAKYSDGIDRLSKLDVYTLPVRRCTPATLTALIAALQQGAGGSRPVAVRTAVALTEALRMALSWAATRQIIPVNPLAGAPLPKAEKRQQRILSEDDVADLVKASEGNPFRVPLLLALYGGLRREEVAALRWEDVDFKRRTLTIRQAITRTSSGAEVQKAPKTSASCRTVTMPRFVMDELRLMPKPCDRVCTTPSGLPYRLDSYPQAVHRLIERVNEARKATNHPPMPLATYHDLRHTHAAMLIRMGIQPKVIQERLGHSSIKMTMDLYGYLMPGLQESVADALDTDFQMGTSGHKSGHKQAEKPQISADNSADLKIGKTTETA